MRYNSVVLYGILFAIPVKASSLDNDSIFNSRFLSIADGKKSSTIDLSYFSKRNSISPGDYVVNVVVNGIRFGEVKITFIPTDEGQVRAVLPPELLLKLGIDVPDDYRNDSFPFKKLSEQFSGASEKFDVSKQDLYIDIPQIWFSKSDWFKTSPYKWDDGLDSLMINYRYSGMYQEFRGKSNRSDILSLNASLALSGWRLRHDSFLSNSNIYKQKKSWQSLSTWAYHNYSFGQGGQLALGQLSTEDIIFESFLFEGAQISSDDGMIASWLSDFSPVIRGVAESPSRIIVRQNATVIWQGDVPAGPFELTDITPLYSGDINVEIRGENGSVKYINQTSSSVPVLLREGRINYNIAVGRYRPLGKDAINSPLFVKASGAIGSVNDLTFYGGSIVSEDYMSAMLGLGKYHEKLGSFSVDISHANSYLTGSEKKQLKTGESVGFAWTRDIEYTNAKYNIGGVWNTSSDYYSFNKLQQHKNLGYMDWEQELKVNYSLSGRLFQPFINSGSLILSGDIEKYYNFDKNGWSTGLSWGFPIGIGFGSISFKYARLPQYNDPERSAYFSLSLPITSIWNKNSLSFNTNVIDYNGHSLYQAGVNGTLKDRSISYGITETYRGKSHNNEESVNIHYRTRFGNFHSNFSHKKDSNYLILGALGSSVIHRGGLTFGQSLNLDGSTALVDTRGASDITINNGTAIKTDFNGYALLPNLVPYQENNVSLDVNSTDGFTEIINTDITVIPSRGSLVPAKFKVVKGNKALITLMKSDGTPVPFGSIVALKSTDDTIATSSIVSNDGMVWISGLPEKGTLLAQWGAEQKMSCEAPYQTTSKTKEILRTSLVCN
ncbi:fimbrial biogenesis outer membrane usher protein [Salmonella enterica]|nr:fimbrial biogenesis outer membrane usher protein [Salmonella enterica]